MPDILKTWPAFMPRERVLRAFRHFNNFYFTLGRGKPQQQINRLFYTHKGEIIGCFKVGEIKRNDGSFPKLRSISGEVSEWQIKRDAWVAICPGLFEPLSGETVFHEAFRGWRYFDLASYRETPESRVNLEA